MEWTKRLLFTVFQLCMITITIPWNTVSKISDTEFVWHLGFNMTPSWTRQTVAPHLAHWIMNLIEISERVNTRWRQLIDTFSWSSYFNFNDLIIRKNENSPSLHKITVVHIFYCYINFHIQHEIWNIISRERTRVWMHQIWRIYVRWLSRLRCCLFQRLLQNINPATRYAVMITS